MDRDESRSKELTLKDIQNYINSGSEGEYSWYQRVTLTIPTPEGTASGSSVMKVTWSENSPRINGAPWVPSIEGAMPIVEVSRDTHVFPLMRNKLNHLPAIFLFPSDKTNEWATEQTLKTITRGEKKKYCVGDDLFPFVVSFTNGKETGVHIYENTSMCINVEEVSEGNVSEAKVDSLLPWLKDIKSGRRSKIRFPTGEVNEIGAPLLHRVSRSDFVRN